MGYKGKEHMNAPPKPSSKEQNAKRPNVGPSKSPHEKLCFSCGKVGHFANDPSCKQYGKARLYIMREDKDLNPLSDHHLPDELEENSVSALQETDMSDNESSAGEWAELADLDEPYMGHLANDNDFFGSIQEVHLPKGGKPPRRGWTSNPA